MLVMVDKLNNVTRTAVVAKRGLHQRQQGFSLIEVSVASLVFAIGLLGVAAMQRLAWQESNQNVWRDMALQLSEDFAERAKGNLVESQSGGYNLFGAQVNPGYNCESTFNQANVGNFCVANEMSSVDRYAFSHAVETRLPDGNAEATQDPNGLYRVVVSWVDPTNGENHQLETQFVP